MLDVLDPTSQGVGGAHVRRCTLDRVALRPPTCFPSQSPVVQPCGGAIPICMVEEFDLPMEIIDRRVTKMKMISPSNREVDVGKTLNEKEWIGMCRREVRRLRHRGQRVQAWEPSAFSMLLQTAMEGTRSWATACGSHARAS